MIKNMLLTSIMVIMGAFVANADTVGDKQLTAKAYVDKTLNLKQDKIPAAGKPGVTAGNTVLTYTPGGNGVIGERGIYSDTSNYNANTDGDKLITASALKDTFDSLPTVETSTMVCANPPTCTLWTITDDTAYDPVTIMLKALINTNGIGRCAKRLSGGSIDSGTTTCKTSLPKYGDWTVVFTYNNETVQISGISACSALSGLYGMLASSQSAVDADYESNMNAAPTESPVGLYCYCKMTWPVESSWVGRSSYSDCARTCSGYCSYDIRHYAGFRSGMFGAVQ